MAGDLQDWDIVSGVGITALAVAAARAVETNRPDGHVRDPFAEAFVQAADPPVHMPTWLDETTESVSESDRQWSIIAASHGMRSKFFDEYFADVCAAGVRQAVLLAAGLDARAFRLDWPPRSTVFEVDQPRVLEFKDLVLSEKRARPRCARQVVAIDLREDWADALLGAGFDPLQPTAWLAEGLLPYLPAQAERQLLDTVHRLSAPGSWLAINNVAVSAALLDNMPETIAQLGIDLSTLFPPGPRDDPAVYLAALGWDVASVTLSELVERYRRGMSSLTPGTEVDAAYYFHTAYLRPG